ncbi:hypothetical protein KHQ81_10990 [Mycoplasmatota bacterium]|nr:hypothetical protein KHQ81_10990 [Mycoplasmatota bacterium]
MSSKQFLNSSNHGNFINIFNVLSGFYSDTSQTFIILIILIFIILSNSSLGIYVDERKGYIKYQYLRISKKEYIMSKLIVNSFLIGVIFIIPQLIFLTFYSFSYTYTLPSIIDYSGCNNFGNCRVALIDLMYDYNYPILNILINQLVKPFIAGILFAITVITFSLIAKRKSLLMLYTNGFVFLLISFYLIIEKLFNKLQDKYDQLSEIFLMPYLGLFTNSEKIYFIPYLISIITLFIILFILFMIFWRKQKYEI